MEVVTWKLEIEWDIGRTARVRIASRGRLAYGGANTQEHISREMRVAQRLALWSRPLTNCGCGESECSG